MSLPPKKFWLSIFLFLLVLSGLMVASILVQKRQLLEKKAAVPTATLSFSPTSFTEPPGSSVDTGIIFNPGGQEVVGVDLVINFTQGILELVRVEPTAQTGTNFKTFAPIVSETNCNFNPDITRANQTGILEFGAVTFDCQTALTCSPSDPNCAKPVPNPANNIVNPLARLQFRVKSGATPGSTGTIRFQHAAGATTDSNVTPYIQAGESVDDILLTASSVVNVTVASAGTPTPTPTLTPGTAQLNFQVKFQGINGPGSARTVKITLKQGGSVVGTFENLNVSSNSSGVYSGTVVNITPSTYAYDVLVKGWAHLQKNVGSINLSSGSNSQNWSGTILLAGDIAGEAGTPDYNMIDASDLGLLISVYNPEVSGVNHIADLNLDGVIEALDLGTLIANYNPGVYGDE